MAEPLSANDWALVGDFIRQELQRRQNAENRRDREKIWKEIDRQIAMIPREREVSSGDKKDWLPDVELPLQFNALEVIAADARRLKFPRGPEWFSVLANLSQSYMDRFQSRRDSGNFLTGQRQQIELDQESADVLIKASIEYYHRRYDFRGQIDMLDTDAIKYGTFVGRVVPVRAPDFSYDFRGGGDQLGPAVVASSIKTTYLDDTPSAFLHEGFAPAPSIIRTYSQSLEKLRQAAKKGGPERGWLAAQIKKFELSNDEKGRQNQVDLAEFEGDLIVPRSRGDSIFLPRVLVTVALNSAKPQPVRFREIKKRSYVVGHYMRDDIKSPYGTSPLMKGQPIQEAATEVLNDLLVVSRLNADPPLWWDGQDKYLQAKGGPDVFPGAQNETDSPNAVEPMEIGDPNTLLSVYLGFLKQYEDLTGVNDPRRGEAAKSHTTAGAAQLEDARGVARTDDFVAGQERGPLESMLYMEYAIIKEEMKRPIPIPINLGGIEGWANISAQDLADEVSFKVQGSAGATTERERAANFLAASNAVTNLAAQAAQAGKSLNVDFEEIAKEIYIRAGEQNAGRFVGNAEGLPAQPPGDTGVSGPNQGAAQVQGASVPTAIQ